jgi:hypothetical protein
MVRTKNIKVGDILIPDDDFISYTGTKEFEVLEIKEFNSTLFMGESALDITLGGIVPVIGSIYGDFREYRTIKTIDHKVNPELHVSKGWNLHGKYCRAIFFTSEEQKQQWTKRYREMKMNNYLHLTRKYGYEG